jgi:hypothetical protein
MMQPARIWYQSFTDPDVDAPYFTRLRGYLRSIAGRGCAVDLFGLRPGDRFLHPITEFCCAAQVISAALRAQREGYDAFVIGHFQEPALSNGLAVAVAAAETVIRLARLNRTATSRRSTYALPPGEAVAEFERLLGLPGPTL